MKRRDHVTFLGGAVVGWPSIVLAQQTTQMRRVGVLTYYNSTEPYGQREIAVLTNALAQLGWTRDRNLQLDVRWTGGSRLRAQAYAKELVDLKPDVIAAFPSSIAAVELRETKTIPVVFAGTTDPVGLGFVRSLARPGGNATGFAQVQLSFAGKWLQSLKEIAPHITRVLAIVSPDRTSGGAKTLPVLRSTAQALNLSLVTRFPRSERELIDAIDAFGREPGGGIVATPNGLMTPFLKQEVAAANRNRLPAIYGVSTAINYGGLMFYGTDVSDQMPQVASYFDRILRGAKPADLPVQNPIKYALIINLKTAKLLGLSVPESLLLRADQVIK